MAVPVGLGAFAQGLAGGIVDRKKEGERQEANARQDRIMDMQLEIARTNADAFKAMAGSRGGTGAAPAGGGEGLGIPPASGAVLQDERDLLARTIQAEAGGEGYQGMLAVGSVINNRARSGNYGGSKLRDVIMKPGQFSAWNGVTGYAGGEGALDMDKMQPSSAALRVADQIIAGGYDDPTGGATHYYNPDAADPKWGQSAGGTWKTIGNHVFGYGDGNPGATRKAPAPTQTDATAKRAAMRADFPAYAGVPDDQLDRAILHFETTRGAVPARGMGVK